MDCIPPSHHWIRDILFTSDGKRLLLAVGSGSNAALDMFPLLIEAQRECCRARLKQSAVPVKGAHFLPEESPEEVGSATARFDAKVLVGQIR